MEVFVRHAQLGADAVEAEFAVGLLEAKGEVAADGLAVNHPLVHTPEVAVAEVEADGVDDLRHDGQLLGGADRAADAGGAVRRGLLPRLDVFERLGGVELLDGFVERDLEAGAGELEDVLLS